MDRRALVLYLQNVRDLEVAKTKIQEMYKIEENIHHNSLSEQLSRIHEETRHYEEEPEWKPGLICGILGAFIVGIGMKLGNISGYIISPKVFIGIGLLMMVPFIMIIIKLCKYHYNYEKMINEVDSFNKQSYMRAKEKKDQIIQEKKNQWEKKRELYLSEENKAEELLDKFYDMNIIPGRYRFLAAVEYLYDFMSTSQASYTDMLLNVKLEEGIQRLEQRLDVIISEVSDLIYETRCMRKDNEYMINQVIKQNKEMLQSLQRSESNSVEAAQYAQLAVNYSAANAYFSLATYLKK